MCACDPGDCPDIRTAANESGSTVVMEVGQWISLQLPGPDTAVTASSSEPSVLKQVGKQRLQYGSDGKVETVYMSFNAVKAGSGKLTIGYKNCDVASVGPCSYQVNVRVVQFPKTKVTVSINNYSPPPTVELRVAESARFAGCCEYPVEDMKATIDRPDVVHWAIEPFVSVTLQGFFEGAIIAASPGTAHVQGEYCPQITGSYCPRVWSLTVVVT